MNVYIKILVDELLKLWNGVTMYDVSRLVGKRKFQFHAMLVWTVHDAPRLTHFVCNCNVKFNNFMKLIYYAWMFFQIIHSFYIIIIDNIVNPSTLYVGIQTK